jgi:hypothetical protein
MQIIIQRVSTATTINQLDSSTTIQTIKQILQKKTRVPILTQVFVFAGKQLDNHKTLGDYNIQSGNTITLVVQNNHKTT